ncbi:MAG: riboflavin synthase [Spirochaetales bacterium]|nr:riboflavin synthase [Leptospiraceae bacterium]MCP5482003.1 riboflavin synthase [Spirochaetales bacterium]MCP5486484.1 riboflavin synthase [Spirochaetales bacterium]
MFTGIIEAAGRVLSIERRGESQEFRLVCPLASEFRVDESVSHNGVCLTVEAIDTTENSYRVTAISETLSKTNLGQLVVGDLVNLERSLRADGRVDGHFVQGHVDCTGTVTGRREISGSLELEIEYDAQFRHLVVPRGSICVNGISLTVARMPELAPRFTIALIPHTLSRTNIATAALHSTVNLEFDILGKYIARIRALGGAP